MEGTRRHRARRFVPALAALGVLALAACSGGSSGTQTTGSPTGGAQAGGQTITVWHYFSDPNQVALMSKYAQLFEAAHPGDKVVNTYVPYDQMDSKVVAAAGSKTGPDVVVFNGAEAATIVLGGGLLPLDSYLSAYPDKAQLPASTLHVVNGKTYAVQGYVNLLGLWYNKDILDKIGVQPPTTMAELETDMQKAKDAGYGGITLSGLPNSQGEWQAYPWITDAGFSYDNLDQNALANGFSRIQNWVKKGWLSQEATTWDQTVPFQTFAAGKVAFAENGNWQMATAKANAKFAYGVVPLPISSTAGIYLGGEGEGIGTYSKNPQLAWEYLTSSYLAPDGQLAAASLVGSLPSRLDVAKNSQVTSDALLTPFATEIATVGAAYPSAKIPPAGVAAVQTAMGQAWSAVIGGQQSPQDAAAAAIQAVKAANG